MEMGHMFRMPAWVWRHCEREAAAQGLRAADIANQIFRRGIEVLEAEKAESAKAREIIASLKAIA